MRNTESFKKFLFKLNRSTPDLLYGIHHPLGLKLLTKLRLGLSNLNDKDSTIILETALTLYMFFLNPDNKELFPGLLLIFVTLHFFLK